MPENAAADGSEVTKCSPAAATCLVQLARFGDLLNILPVAKAIADQEGGKVTMLVHPEFHGLLEGLSYVDLLPWTGDQLRPQSAAASVSGKFERVIISQVASGEQQREKICESFNMESWRHAGFLDRWTDPRMTLLLDNRSPEREALLLAKLGLEDKPFILFNGASVSSPFMEQEQLLWELHSRFCEQVRVVNLSQLRAERYQDVLGLLDRAMALVSIDTATLHLAAASHVPVIALLSDHKGDLWLGSKLRYQPALSMRYREYPIRKEEIFRTLDYLLACPPARVHIPVTLLGVDNFTPGRTLYAMQTVRFVSFADHRLATMEKPPPNIRPAHIKLLKIMPWSESSNEGRLMRERFLIHRLHECFETSHCLHMEQDSRVANPEAWDPRWLQFDYIGAPWPWPYNQPPFPPCTPRNCVGNLGFALLSRRFCETVAKIANPTDEEARLSDVYICRTLRPKLEAMGMRFAPEQVARKFSVEGCYWTGSLGWHGRTTAQMNGFPLM